MGLRHPRNVQVGSREQSEGADRERGQVEAGQYGGHVEVCGEDERDEGSLWTPNTLIIIARSRLKIASYAPNAKHHNHYIQNFFLIITFFFVCDVLLVSIILLNFIIRFSLQAEIRKY